MDKTKLNLERLRAYDAEWEEDKHPRAENGQFTSGGGSAGGSSGASSTKKYNQKDLLKLANNHLNYHLGSGETDATADKVEIVSKPDKYGNVDAKVSYNVTVRIPYQETDWDGYTSTTYEEDSVYRTDIIPLNISELKPEEPEAPKSPLRQAAEAVQGGDGRLKGYKGLSFTQETSEADSGTPAGEVHNLIVGNLKGKEPTKENVTAACKQVVNMLNDDIKYLSERAATARRYGNEQAAKEWEANIEKQQQRIQAAYEVTMGFSK